MYDEINVLLASLGRAFKVKGEVVAKAIETGDMMLNLGTDKDGDRYVEASYKGEVALVYPGSAKDNMEPSAAEEI